jgi:putative thioredoxin
MVTEVVDFQQQVIEVSREKPVLVDFWAPWCGPCRMLGPVLEKLEGENGGAWTLAKVNTDENPDVSRRFAVSSIPAVKLFVDGRVADEFVGALPEPRVRQWLDKAIPSQTRRKIEEAASLLDQSDTEAAKAVLEEVLAAEPENGDARILLARALAFDDPTRAVDLIEDDHAYDPKLLPTREAVRTIGRLSGIKSDQTGLLAEKGGRGYVRAIGHLGSGHLEDAMSGLVDVVRENRRLDDDGARRALLALFTLLGDQDPRTRKYRRALGQALF